VPSDPASALQWAFDHGQEVIWIFGTIAGTIGWIVSRQRKWLARAAAARARTAQPAAMVGPVAAARVAPPPVQPSPAAPPRSSTAWTAPSRPAVAPSAAPALNRPSGSGVFRGAFGDPAHARTAVILAEVLAPPVALR
jgi:hypothetical protein